MNKYSQDEYAKLKGVTQPYIAKLIKKRLLLEVYDHEKEGIIYWIVMKIMFISNYIIHKKLT